MKSSKKPKKYENLLYLRKIGKNRHLQSILGKIRAISPLYFIFDIKALHLSGEKKRQFSLRVRDVSLGKELVG